MQTPWPQQHGAMKCIVSSLTEGYSCFADLCFHRDEGVVVF